MRHPINNRRALEYLRKQLGCDEADVNGWCATWIGSGFDAFEAMLAANSRRGRFCFGDAPRPADPQRREKAILRLSAAVDFVASNNRPVAGTGVVCRDE
jgi:hypothetical protein